MTYEMTRSEVLEWVRMHGGDTGHFVSDAACDDFATQLAERLSLDADTQRCIDARNALNDVIHGEGAVIDDLEDIVALAAAQIKNLRATNESLRRTIADPPGDVQEAVLKKLGLYPPRAVSPGTCGDVIAELESQRNNWMGGPDQWADDNPAQANELDALRRARDEIDAALAGFVPSRAFLQGVGPQSAWPFAQHDHTGYLEYASWDMAAIRKEAKP